MNSTDLYLNKRAMGDDQAFLNAMRGGLPSESGVVVNHQTALTHNPVWAAINRISGDIAKLPFNMYQRMGDDSRELALSHPTFNVVRRKSNSKVAAFRFWRTLMFHSLLWNRGYAWIERNAIGQCTALWNLPPERVYPEYEYGATDQDNFTYYRVTLNDGSQALVPYDNILDLPGLQYDLGDRIDLVQLAKNSWGVGMAGESFLNKFFSSGAIASGILEVPPETQPQSAKNLVEGLDSAIRGLSNSFNTLVLRDGAKYHQLTVRPVDAQMAELLAANVKDVARWFNIPPSKLGAEGSTAYGSREADARDYLDSCLSPWLANIQAQCWLKLLTVDAQNRDRYYFEHNVGALLETDTLTKYQVLEIGIRTGLHSPDEGRKMLNLNPRGDGYGDVYYFSNNMQPVTEETMNPQDSEPDGNMDPEPADDEEVDIPEEVVEEVERQWNREVMRLATKTRSYVRGKVRREGNDWLANNAERLYEKLYGEMLDSSRAYALITGRDAEALCSVCTREYIDNLLAEVAK